jgi:dihydrofolate reductase
MSKLMYVTNTSLDGYIEDESGAFDWGRSEEAFPFATEFLRTIGTTLYGRRLYETMTFWSDPAETYRPEGREFARLWQNMRKIVFSRTLKVVTAPNTRVEDSFDSEAVRNVKRESEQDMAIGGAEIAGLAIEANLVDECHLLIHPVILGGGKRALPTGVRRNLKLLETHRIGPDVTYVRYRINIDNPFETL